MDAGPRDNEETAVDEVERTAPVGRIDDLAEFEARSADVPLGNGGAAAARPRGARGMSEGLDSEDTLGEGGPGEDGAEVRDEPEGTSYDTDADTDADAPAGAEEAVEPQELRPQRKLRLWQLAPIVVLSALGSLMFAFPLAFEPGGGTGAVVSMLGLLICGCAAGWAVVAAHRVGLAWPGLPAPDSGRRPDWRIVALYAVVVGTVVLLAIWRVARLS